MVQRPGGQGKKQNFSTGSYGGSSHSQLTNVQLPEKLQCLICKRFKRAFAGETGTPAGYSNKQLAEARLCKSRGQPYSVKCISCSGVPKGEMLCTYCQKTKELSCFALTHRRDPDNARCMACVEENARLNPQELADSEAKHIQKLEELDEDDSDDSGPTVTNEDCSSYGDSNSSLIDLNSLSMYNTTSSTSQVSSLSTRNASNNTSMNTSGRASSGGVRLPGAEHGVSAWQTVTGTRLRRGLASSNGVNGSDMSGTSTTTLADSASTFNTHAYGNPKAPASVAGSFVTSNWSNTRAYSSALPVVSSGKFPRIKAYKDVEAEEDANSFAKFGKEKDETEDSVPSPEDWESEDSDVPTDSDEDDSDDSDNDDEDDE